MKKMLSVLLMICLLIINLSAIAEIDISSLDLPNASDDELEALRQAVVAEQKSRIITRIVFDQDEITLGKGSTVKLKTEITDVPEGVKPGKYTWSTADATIATVNNGSIRGVNVGTTTITCATVLSDGTEISSDCSITVIIPVKSISFKTKKTEQLVGNRYTGELTVQPADATIQTVKYESSDPAVAAVDEKGQVFVLDAGTVTISATTIDGSNKSASYTIVSKAPPVMTIYKSYEPDGNDLYFIRGDYDLQMDSFVIKLSMAEYVLYDKFAKDEPGPIRTQIRLQKENPDGGWALVYAGVKVFDMSGIDDPSMIREACYNAYTAHAKYNLSLYNNDPSIYSEMIMDDLEEPVNTAISGEACIKWHGQLYTSEEKISALHSGDPYLYYFPDKGYLITVSYEFTDEETDPDKLLSSILSWK